MPAKFGSIAKVHADRVDISNIVGNEIDINVSQFFNFDGDDSLTPADATALITKIQEYKENASQSAIADNVELNNYLTQLSNFYQAEYLNPDGTIAATEVTAANFGAINLYVLAYTDQKQLTTLTSTNDSTPHPTMQNLKEFLNEFRLLTDNVQIQNGYIINFGVAFDVIAHRSANKADVKLRCINKIKDYFNIDKMQFRQPIYTSDLEYELMGVEGVRAINYVELSQDFSNTHNSTNITNHPILYCNDSNNPTSCSSEGTAGYGWKYDFKTFYDNTNSKTGIILPSSTPAVFELKNPNTNIQGRVR